MARQRRVLFAAAAALLLSALPIFAARLPPRPTWRGTLATTDGRIAAFSARTRRVYDPRGIEAHYEGRFRCRGSGCFVRRGSFEAYPWGPGQLGLVLFFSQRASTYCAYSLDASSQALP